MSSEYVCWKCDRLSWAGGGRPVCCYCVAKAKAVKFDLQAYLQEQDRIRKEQTRMIAEGATP